MGKKNQRKSRVHGGNASAMDMMDSQFSDLFKTLPPIKRAELTKVVEKLFQVSSNFASDPTTPAKQWEEYCQISELVEKVRQIEAGFSMCRMLPDRKSAVKPFLAWLQKSGAVFDKVDIADYGSQGLGLRLKEGVEKAEEVIRIPQKAMMSVETAKSSSIGSLIERDPLLQTMPNVVLAIHLLIERNSPASLWEPYINILPHSYTTVLYFTPKQLEGLKGSPALEEALRQYKFVARQYAYFYKLFANTMLKDYLTYDEYRWAVSTVMTRQNLVPKLGTSDDDDDEEGGGLTNTLIPLWDMANHDQGEISTDFDVEKGESLCYAHRTFTAGEQLTIFYGVRSNCDLLIHNGFVFPDNQEDCLTLRLGVAKTDPLSEARLALLDKLGIVSQKFHLRRSAEPFDGKLMAFLRVLQMDQAQIAEWTSGEAAEKLLDIEAHTSSDSKAMQYMITRATLLLRAYPTTMEQDVETMKHELAEVDKLACQLRLSEKRILVNCVAYCETKLKQIQAESKAAPQ